MDEDVRGRHGFKEGRPNLRDPPRAKGHLNSYDDYCQEKCTVAFITTMARMQAVRSHKCSMMN